MKKIIQYYGPLFENPSNIFVLIVGLITIMLLLTNVPTIEYIKLCVTHEVNEDLKDPTYDEMRALLLVDDTDKNEYKQYIYNCVSFSKDLLQYSKDKGYLGYFVVVDVQNSFSNHAIVMYNTTDRGKIYVEPQTDEIKNADKLTILEEIPFT